MRGRTPSEGRFVGTGSAHAALTIGSRALGASEPRQVRKEAALRTPSQVPRYRPIRASDAGTSGDADLEDGARGRALSAERRAPNCRAALPLSTRANVSARTAPIPVTSRSSASDAAAIAAMQPNRSTRRRADSGLTPGIVASTPAGDTAIRRRPRRHTVRPSAERMRTPMSRSQIAVSPTGSRTISTATPCERRHSGTDERRSSTSASIFT